MTQAKPVLGHCAHCGLPGLSHGTQRECIDALRDQIGGMQLAAEDRQANHKAVRLVTHLMLDDRREVTLSGIRSALDEQYQLISALEERVRILDAERVGQRSNLLAFPGEEHA